MSVYVTQDDYIEIGYAPADFVGSDDDLYIESGFVSGIVEGVVSISADVTQTAKGGFLVSATATSSSALTQTTSAISTLAGTSTSASSFTTSIDADVIRNGSASSNSAVSSQVSGVATLVGDVDSSAAWTTTVTAVGIIRESSDIAVNATLASSAIYTASALININAFQSHPTLWGDDISWNESVDKIWGPMVQVEADTRVNAEASVSSQFGLTVDGDVTAIADISPAASATVDVVGNFDVRGTVDISSAATLTSEAQTRGDAFLTMSGVFDLSASGIFQVEGRPFTQASAFGVSVDGDVIRDGIAIKAGSFTQTTTAVRTRPFVANLSSAFTVDVDADRVSDAINIISSSGTLRIEAVKTTSADVDINSDVTLPRWVGGILFGGVIDIEAFATQVSVLTIFNIDPFRVYTIENETRSLGIIQESRIYKPNIENRLNTIESENREYAIPSETRNLEVETSTLVEVAGNPLDRRTG